MSDKVAARDELYAEDEAYFDDDLLAAQAGQTGYLLPYAVVASLFVLGAPLVTVVAAVVAVPSLHPSVLVGLAIATAGVAVVTGMILWDRRPESAVVSFDELLPWHAVARHRAERRLSAVSELLGFRSPREARAASPPSLTTLYQIVAALEAKDPYTHRHSGRVERHVRRTAVELGLPAEDIEEACRAAALHDVGKIHVPDDILRKPEPLTDDEWNVIARHPAAGARLVAGAVPHEVVAGIRHHHERWDGGGYPDGIGGATIPLYARLIAVADTFDALTSGRPYRPGLSHSEAKGIIEREAGRQFDPQVAEAFLATLSRHRPLALAFIPLMWRRATLPVRAAGSSVVTSAVASMAILGAGVVPTNEPAPPPAVYSRPDVGGGTVGRPPFVMPEVSEPKDEKTTNSARRKARRNGSAGAAEKPAPARADAAAASEPAPPADAASSAGTATTPSEPAPAPAGAAPTDDPPSDKARGHKPPGDPQPDKGQDCPSNGSGQGQGSSKHCG